MQTKFIEGTDQQYSIREDGVVIRHYRFIHNINNQKIEKNVKDVIMKEMKGTPNQKIVPIKQFHTISVNKLLRKYFGFIYCDKCNVKVEDKTKGKRTKRLCANCKSPRKSYYKPHPLKLLSESERLKRSRASKEKWKKNNKKKVKLKEDLLNKKKLVELPKYEIASRLNLKVSELPDELYHQKRNLILLKRQVAKEHNISILSLNH